MRKKLQEKKKQWMEWLTGLFARGKELIKTVREHMAELSREQELEERKIQTLKRMIRYAGELLLVLFVFCALMQHVWIGQVQGASMRPTYQDGQFILLLRGKEYNRGDVVGVEYSAGEEKTILLKRIIAIGGDVVSCKYGQLYVNGQKISESDHTVGKTSDIPAQTVPDGSVYLLGDNREHSMDSRNFGCMSCEDIIGKVVH